MGFCDVEGSTGSVHGVASCGHLYFKKKEKQLERCSCFQKTNYAFRSFEQFHIPGGKQKSQFRFAPPFLFLQTDACLGPGSPLLCKAVIKSFVVLLLLLP